VNSAIASPYSVRAGRPDSPGGLPAFSPFAALHSTLFYRLFSTLVAIV